MSDLDTSETKEFARRLRKGTHDDTNAVMEMVGSDDAALNRQKARLELFLNPPMKSETKCTQPHVTTGGINVPGRCDTFSVVDNDALQRKAAEIESKK